VQLAFQLLASKIVRKNFPTQVTRFMVDLAGKCVEGMQINWENYFINKIEKDVGHTYHTQRGG
jgi:hypothetical protein